MCSECSTEMRFACLSLQKFSKEWRNDEKERKDDFLGKGFVLLTINTTTNSI